MSVKIIQERLDQYHPTSWQEEERALKEIFQEIALAGLGRTDFFKKAVFQGGTALRILYSLNRFSEDLDFILKKPAPGFQLNSFLKTLKNEFDAYGISIETQRRAKTTKTVQEAFLKEDSLGSILVLKHYPRDRRPKQIKIKLEVDTNPPGGSGSETRYLDFPFPFAVTVQDLPSLFASKGHALLSREYVKGRDWYDFLWYVARKTSLNYKFLGNACEQQGPWAGKKIAVDKEWILLQLERKIRTIQWKEAKNDVARFLNSDEVKSLELWGEPFFLDRLKKLEAYLE